MWTNFYSRVKKKNRDKLHSHKINISRCKEFFTYILIF